MSWPHGKMDEALIQRLNETPYDDLEDMDKIAWIFYKMGSVPMLNEENTKLTQADEKIDRALQAMDTIFERLWYVSKEDPKLLAMHKCWNNYYDKVGRLKRFRYKVRGIKMKQERAKRKPAYRKRPHNTHKRF